MHFQLLQVSYNIFLDQIIMIDNNVLPEKKKTKINKTIQQGLCVLFNNTLGILSFKVFKLINIERITICSP